MMLWGGATMTVKNSYLSGAGGPLVILSDDELDVTSTDLPSLTITDTVTDSALSGGELWFHAVGATAILDGVKAMNQVLVGYQMGTLFNDSNMLGILGVLMASGSSADSAIADGRTQGTLKINGEGLDRYIAPGTDWFDIVTSNAYQGGAPFFTVTDDEGNVHTLYLVQMSETEAYFFNPDGTQFNPQGSLEQGATYMAFANAKMITLSMGGLSIVFDFHH
jgi:hypothetical protein